MTIFDTIRYPVTDIYDPSSFRGIPTIIIREWLDECRNMLFPDSEQVDMRSLDSAYVIKLTIMAFRIDHEIPEDYLKAYFTSRLREKIAAYDS